MKTHELNIRIVNSKTRETNDISLEEFIKHSQGKELKIENNELYHLYSFWFGHYCFLMTEWHI